MKTNLKRLIALFLTAAALSSLAACGSPSSSGSQGSSGSTSSGDGTLAEEQKIVYNCVESSSYDPIRDEQTGETVAQMFEGVYCWDQGELVLGQGKSVEVSEDGLTYTITLRDDIYWSDGEPVTSDDFIYSWMRELDPNTAAKYVNNLYCIENAQAYNSGECDASEVGIKKVDDKVFTVTLSAPSVCFEELLAFKCYLPVRQDIVETYGESWSLSPETCIGNGPFKMVSYTPAEKMVLQKNEHYYGADDIIIEELEIRFITESSVEQIAYETGDIQIAVKPTAETCQKYSDEATYLTKLSTMWLVVDCQDDVLQDPRVRQALSMAIDRQALCDMLGGGETPAYSIVPKTEMDYSADEYFVDVYAPYFSESVEEARALLAEAGYPDGAGFPEISYGTSSGTEYENVAQAICAMWKQNLGITCNIQVEDSSAFISHRKEQGYFDVARYTMAGSYSDPIVPLALYGSTDSANDSHYANPEYDALLEQARAEGDMDKKFDLYHQLDQMLTEDAAVIPLYYPSLKYLIKPTVQDVGINSTGMLEFKSAYVLAG